MLYCMNRPKVRHPQVDVEILYVFGQYLGVVFRLHSAAQANCRADVSRRGSVRVAKMVALPRSCPSIEPYGIEQDSVSLAPNGATEVTSGVTFSPFGTRMGGSRGRLAWSAPT